MAFSCPVPTRPTGEIQLAHGGGGAMTRDLVEGVILPAYGMAASPAGASHDGAVLDIDGARLAFTTDGYVVQPHRFAGGDIGDLAVNGTINDLAMCGARPLSLSVAFIIEEGFSVAALEDVARSMGLAAEHAGVILATGDTKVVDRGSGDGVFVTTSGVGVIAPGVDIRPARVRPGDVAVLSGDVGRHGTAVMSAREGLSFESTIESDTRPLCHAVAALLDAGVDVHCLRDATRGGLATSLIEIAMSAAVEIRIDEAAVPVDASVRGACELLGLDPLYVANEGRFIAFVPKCDQTRALAALRADPAAVDACVIGEVAEIDIASAEGMVIGRTAIGGERVLDLPSGEQLPRIC